MDGMSLQAAGVPSVFHHDGPMTPLHRPSQQHCSGGTPPTVPVSLRRLSAAGSPLPAGGLRQGGAVRLPGPMGQS